MQPIIKTKSLLSSLTDKEKSYLSAWSTNQTVSTS